MLVPGKENTTSSCDKSTGNWTKNYHHTRSLGFSPSSMFQTLTVSSAEHVRNEPGGRAAWRLSDTLGYTWNIDRHKNEPKIVSDSSNSLPSVIVWVSVVLKRTVVGDWRFDNLCGSHLQSQVKCVSQSMVRQRFHNISTLLSRWRIECEKRDIILFILTRFNSSVPIW